MDEYLISAARAVKRRHCCPHPTLWLFTDQERLANPLAAVARLPGGIRAPGLCGVVLRDDDRPDRVDLARRVAALCRARRIALVIAGDWRLAASLGAGVHLRGGEALRTRWRGRIATASAHDGAALRAARRNGAMLVFLSPAFITASHPGGRALGPVRWARLAHGAGLAVLALGGIAARDMARLGRECRGAGAISALSPR